MSFLRSGKAPEGRKAWIPQPHRPKKKGGFKIATLSVLMLLMLLDPFALASEPDRSKNVLVLYSNNIGFRAHAIADQGIRSAFESYAAIDQIVFYSEYMDLGRFSDEHYPNQLLDLYQYKYSRVQIDLIIAVSVFALDFLVKYGEELFPGTPIVFCQVEKRRIGGRKLRSNITGAFTAVDIRGTLETALKIHPDTQRVAVVAGTAETDRFFVKAARQVFQDYENKVEFIYLTYLPMEELLKRTADLPEHTIIFYLTLYMDGAGKDFVPWLSLSHISRVSNAPIYSCFDTYLGHGIVGGRLCNLEAMGVKTGELGLRILQGERPEDLPILDDDTNTFMFDRRQMRQWGISMSDLPPGSIVRYKDPSIWNLYKWPIIVGGTLCLLEISLILFLLMQRAMRRNAEKALRENEAKYRVLVEQIPAVTYVISIDNLGDLFFISTQIESMMGFSQSEYKDNPAFWRELFHPKDRDRVIAEISSCIDKKEPFVSEYRMVAHDGHVVWCHDEGVVVYNAAGKPIYFQGIFIDISQLKTANEQIHTLSQQLMTAQESERQMISRELHDRVAQDLSTLKIGLKTIFDNQQAIPTQARERASAMSDILQGSIMAVRDLAYELRPAGLDELGLIQTVLLYCHDFTENNGIRVDFRPTGINNSVLDNDLEINLYRLIQEALNNIRKHADAGHVDIRLAAAFPNIILHIQDDGKGFDVDGRLVASLNEKRMGLRSMQERVSLLHGEITIQSRPMQGTRIYIKIPLQERENGSEQYHIDHR